MRAAAPIAAICIIASSAALAQSTAMTPPVRPEPANLLSWLRAPVDQFGCMIESGLGVRPQRFNCALQGYVNRGDPCRGTDVYYEGPKFPAQAAEKVSPAIGRIEVAYEGGRVQSVTAILKQRRTRSDIRALLSLPAAHAPLPQNVSLLDIQGCRAEGAAQLCDVVYIEGFDHLGAGDIECREEGVPPDPTPGGGSAGSGQRAR